MQKNESKLTVFFDGAFWVGVYERVCGGKLEACKITFGAQPSEGEVYEFLLQNWASLRFGPPVVLEQAPEGNVSPKRRQRLIKRQMECPGAGTKAQQALGLARQQGREQAQERRKQRRQEESAQKFALRRQKQKARHRGKA